MSDLSKNPGCWYKAMLPLIIVSLIGIAACAHSIARVIPTPDIKPPPGFVGPPAPAVGKDGKVDPLEEAKYEMQLYAEKAAQAVARYDGLKKQANEEALNSQIRWITGLCLMFAAICGVVAFIAPVGKKMIIAAAVGFTTVAVAAQAFSWAIPYLPWIGGVLVVGGGLWAGINWNRLGKAVKNAAEHGDQLEEWLKSLPDDAREQAEKFVDEVKTKSKEKAVAAGIHPLLQALRGKPLESNRSGGTVQP